MRFLIALCQVGSILSASLSRRQSLATGASSVLSTGALVRPSNAFDALHDGVVRKYEIESPPLSLRQYRAIELESGLRCLLCLAPGKSEIAVTVGAGQLRDTENFDGLSHLTEHLTMTNLEFAASALEGGYTNAETRFDRTVFHANCDAAEWNSLLRIVGSAFSRHPVFDAQLCRRELARVDAELTDRPLSTSAIEYDALIRKAARADDPLSRFGPGSRDSLLHHDDAIGLARAASALYEKYYLAHAATVAVIADAPDLDSLESAVVKAFRYSFPRGTQASRSDKGHKIPFVPLPASIMSRQAIDSTNNKKGAEVVIAWKLPYSAFAGKYNEFERCKPHVVASHLLAHPGPGSIQANLQHVFDHASKRYLSAHVLIEGDRETGYCLFQVRALGPSVKAVLAVLEHGLASLRDLSTESLIAAANDCKDLAELLAWSCPPGMREPTAVELANDMKKCVSPFEFLSLPRRIDERAESVAASTQRLFQLLTLDTARILTTEQGNDPSIMSLPPLLDTKNSLQYHRNPYAAAFAHARPRSQRPPRPVARIRQEPMSIWHAPGRWHLSTGRLMKSLQPLMSLVAFYPAPALSRADDTLRDGGHAWLLNTRQALASPLYDAVLAGHKYEIQYVADADGTPGLRLALAGFADADFHAFAIDFARRLYHLTHRDSAATFLWTSMLAAHDEARVLVAGDVETPAADKIALDFTRTLLPGALLRSDSADTARRLLVLFPSLLVPAATAAKPDPPPPSVLLRPAYWDHPVAKNLGFASGVPSLVPGFASS